MNYYNEHDPKAAHWLRCLIAAGLIPDGHVDERSICDVKPSDLDGYLQVHLFAGIGGWSYALALAGWPTDASVWTGSCPCQPFSSAGKRRGTDDERHVWPEMHRLVQECEPATIFGEQVAGSEGLKWFAGVRTDLEQSGYAVGCADLPAASVGAPHKRQRLFWVADADRERQRETRRRVEGVELGGGVATCSMGDATSRGRKRQREEPAHSQPVQASESNWSNFDVISCESGKWRRIESGLKPLVDGFPGRVAFLRGLGNAIVPQVAAKFIRAYMESV